MQYTVYDYGKLAVYPANVSDPAGEGWHCCSFSTFDAALTYARKWLGVFVALLPADWDGSVYDVSGYNDTIEIRKEDK